MIPQSGVVTGLVTTLVLHFFSHPLRHRFSKFGPVWERKLFGLGVSGLRFPACQFL